MHPFVHSRRLNGSRHVRRIATLGLVLLLTMLAACIFGDDLELDIKPADATLEVGESVELLTDVVEVLGGNKRMSRVACDGAWSSTNPEVATVQSTANTQSAMVTGVSPGTTQIRVRCTNHWSLAKGAPITVVPAIDLSIVPAAVATLPGGTVALNAVVTGTPHTHVSWASLNEGVATVSSAGVVTGVAPGTTRIRASLQAHPSKTAEAIVTVGGLGQGPLISGASHMLPGLADALGTYSQTSLDLLRAIVVDRSGNLTVLEAAPATGNAQRTAAMHTGAQALGPTLSVVRAEAEVCPPGSVDLFVHRSSGSAAAAQFTAFIPTLGQGCRGALGSSNTSVIDFQRPLMSGATAALYLVFSDFRGFAHLRHITEEPFGRVDVALTPDKRSCPWSVAARPGLAVIVAREGAVGTTNEECNDTRGLYKVAITGFGAANLAGSLVFGTMPREVVLSPDGSTAYVADYAEDLIYVIDVAAMTVSRTIAATGGPVSLSRTADGALLLVAYWNTNEIGVIDAITGTDLGREDSGGEQPVRVRFAPDDETVWALNYGKDGVASGSVKVFTLMR